MQQIAATVFGIGEGENTKPMILFIVRALSFPVLILSFTFPLPLYIMSLAVFYTSARPMMK